MSELHGEKIDIVDWSDDPAELVAHALSPARVTSVEVVDAEARSARVVVPDFQLSLAIGKEGQNARLAARLTGWRIDIRSDEAEARARTDAPRRGRPDRRCWCWRGRAVASRSSAAGCWPRPEPPRRRTAGSARRVDRVPLESFDDALTTLHERCERLVVLGTSRGAEAALLLGARHREIDAVVAISPSDVVWAALSGERPQRSSWTSGGEPLPFVPLRRRLGRPTPTRRSTSSSTSTACRRYADRVPAAPDPGASASPRDVVLVAGGDDRLWPSLDFAEQVGCGSRGRRWSATPRPGTGCAAGRGAAVAPRCSGTAADAGARRPSSATDGCGRTCSHRSGTTSDDGVVRSSLSRRRRRPRVRRPGRDRQPRTWRSAARRRTTAAGSPSAAAALGEVDGDEELLFEPVGLRSDDGLAWKQVAVAGFAGPADVGAGGRGRRRPGRRRVLPRRERPLDGRLPRHRLA